MCPKYTISNSTGKRKTSGKTVILTKICYISDFKLKKSIKARPLELIYNYGCGELDLLYNLYYGVGRAV